MFIYMLFGISMLISFFSSVLNKKFQMSFKMDFVHFLSYNLINAYFGATFLFISNGFRINMNWATFLFSLIYASIVILSLIITLVALSRISISFSGIISTAGSVIIPSMVGFLFLGEDISYRLILSMLLLLFAVFLPCRSFKNDGRKNSISVCIALFLITGASIILNKLYTLTPGVCDTRSYFVMTNLLIIVFCAAVVLLYKKRHSETKNILKLFSKKQVGNIAARTLFSNIASVISVILLARMNISVYTIISSSVGILSGAILSKFIFKEYMPRENWISVFLVIFSIIVSPQ